MSSFSKAPFYRWIPLVLSLAYCLAMSLTKANDFDLGFHIRTGEWIYQHHAFPHVDPFSYSQAGQSWYLQEGIPALIFYLINQHLGLIGLTVFKAVILMLAYLGVGRLLLKREVSSGVTALVLFIGIMMGEDRFLLRPYVISLFFLSLELNLLWEWKKTRTRLPELGLYLLFPVWLSCHALAYHGFIILALTLLGEALDIVWKRPGGLSWQQWWPRAISGAGMVVFTILAVGTFHPNGWGFMLRIVDIVSEPMARVRIQELGPLYLSYGINGPFLLMAGGGLLLGFLNRRLLSCGDALLFVAFVLFPLHMGRFIDASALILPSVVGVWLMQAGRSLLGGEELMNLTRLITKFGLIVVSVYIVLFGACHLYSKKDLLGFGWYPGIYPAQAYAFIDRAVLPGEIFNDMFFGGTFIYHFYPRRLVFVDGRAHYSEWFLEKVYGRAKRAEPGWGDVLERYNVNTLLLHSTRFPAIRLAALRSPDWVLVYRDYLATIFVRRGTFPALGAAPMQGPLR